MQKRLYRSRSERMISGVCGGLAEYFNIDPTLIRLLFVITIFCGGAGILAYIILAIVTPNENSQSEANKDSMRANLKEMEQTAENIGHDIKSALDSKDPSKETGETQKYSCSHKSSLVIGTIFLIAGILLLLSNLGPFNFYGWLSWGVFWPIILIILGLLIIFRRRKIK